MSCEEKGTMSEGCCCCCFVVRGLGDNTRARTTLEGDYIYVVKMRERLASHLRSPSSEGQGVINKRWVMKGYLRVE